MSAVSMGDLAQSVLLRRQNVEIKAEISRLTSELSSGRVQDVTRHLGADLSYLTDVERSLQLNAAVTNSTKEAASYTAMMQSSLNHMQEALGGLSSEILGLNASGLNQTAQHVSSTARAAMDTILSTLNTSVAGRALFAGSTTDAAAMQGAETILSDLRGAVAGQTTLAGVEAVLDNWFDVGGGYDSVAYSGGSENLSPFQLGDGERIELNIKADDAVFRETLKAVSLAVLSQDNTLGFGADLKTQMLTRSGELSFAAGNEITGTRANLGYAEARIEDATVRLAVQKTSFEMARNALISADPYDTVVKLEQTQFRLESLYTATARLSELSLVGFLR